MQRVTIGRYREIPADIPRQENFVPAQDAYSGWIEGVRDDGTEWILFLDSEGSPSVYWPNREARSVEPDGGAVVGDPVFLTEDPTLAGPLSQR
ncbi:Uncharacterised protein [Mycolicibacterium vanbaalenii]|uniref:Uncharacterized protein n=1 Tax=Mycolicibacterium vanbaalenii TaxID=110539 RepID=A0A5S9RA27_MYCVN|nr:hypothetical protein [Mycolicibacterium vanbaalenii]CAA0134561.1 Uncharacterised protein [Mycolicibacterium vanbaalenii]